MKIDRRLISAALATTLLILTGCTKTVVTSELVKTGTDATTSVISGSETEVSAPKSTHDDDKGELIVDDARTDPNANYDVKGTVTVAVDTARATDYEALFDSLKSVYTNIDIKFDYFAHSSEDSAAEYLSTRTAAGKMPDIIWDEAGKLPLYIQQGWVYPLDEFVKDDPDFEYVPSNLVRDYTFGGKLYALPHQAHFEETFINLDVLDAINKKLPQLDWTPDDFEEYLRAASTDKYSGIEMLAMIPTMLTNAFNPETTLYGYNLDTKQFDVSGFVEAVKYTVNLRAIPNLEAWALRRSTTGGKTDYVIKFGSSDDMTAFNKGLTLFHGVGTWELADAATRWSNMNWTMWTIPQNSSNPGAMPLHVDHCFMTSACKNPETAFQVLRYITYSTEGNLARLSMYDEANQGKYATINNVYYPTTTNPKVAEKFNSLPGVTETDKYLFANIDKCMRYDLLKIVPGWNDVLSNYLSDYFNKAMDGTVANVEPILKEMESKANEAIAKEWSNFNSKLAKVQADFDSTH